MSPTNPMMAAEEDKESLESRAEQEESISCVSVMAPSPTGAVSLTWAPTQKGDSPKSGKLQGPVVCMSEATEYRNTAREEELEFLQNMPMINEEFDIRGKIGEGTFSSVFLASLKGHPEEKVAIKHLVPTSSSSRIENEVHCLQQMGGSDHIMSLLTCVRHRDHIALIMPYFKHDRFIDYLHVMSLNEVREYMRALLVALRAVHSRQIIHRDIKPSNFLYSRSTNQFQLVDFGLAHAVQTYEESSQNPSLKTRSRTAIRGEPSSSTVSKLNGIVAPPPTYSRQLHLRGAVRVQRQSASSKSKATVSKCAGKSEMEEIRLCPLRHKPTEVCDICMARSNQAAPRAGTPGFRAPEVLLKSLVQTTAVDIWSAGVIFLSLLSGRYPFFRAHDDLCALSQIISLLGSKECSRAANEFGKDLVCVPEMEPTDLKSLCTSLRNTLSKSVSSNAEYMAPPTKKSRLSNKPTAVVSSNSPKAKKCPKKMSQSKLNASTEMADASWSQIPDEAFDLLYKMLDFNPSTRLTADRALEHSFLHDQT